GQYTWVSAVERVVIEHPTLVLPFIAEFAPSLVLASYFRFLPRRGLLISLCAVRSSALCACASHNLSQRQDNEQSRGSALESTPHQLPATRRDLNLPPPTHRGLELEEQLEEHATSQSRAIGDVYRASPRRSTARQRDGNPAPADRDGA